jgi:predicted adenine nucleotide alpha hydrolase (AANH) superfamily ATPase
LLKTAEFAAEMGFETITTSLLVSPYQKHELIRAMGEKAAAKFGLTFYYKDFRPYFREGQ